jgi:hypothetical protein
MIPLLVSDFRKISVSVPSIPVAVLVLAWVPAARGAEVFLGLTAWHPRILAIS